MIVKEVFLKDEGQAKLRSGIKKIAGAVKSTLGPSGQTVLLESENHTRGLTVTKDGVTIARSINLFDPIENLAVQLMKQAADQTAVAAGDGPQPLYSKILTPNGWTTMGEIKVGDEICGTNNSTQNVLAIFPKGLKRIYKVKTEDGRVVECCSEHLWKVIIADDKTSLEAILTTDSANQFLVNGVRVYLPFFDKENNKDSMVRILEIKLTDKEAEMQCIKVSNEDSLYVTDDYVYTHNTSTSIVLTEAIIDAFQELDFNRINKTEVIRGVNAITEDIVKLLDSMSRKVSKRTLVDVATISANNDKELGKLIADTFKKVDLVTVENSANALTYNEIISGMRIDRGWTSKYFVNNEKTEECVFENPYILLTDIEINNLTLLEETLAHVIREQKPLLIIGNLSPNALNTLNMNVARKVIKACHIIPPSFGYRQKDLMFDLSVALGAKYISESIGDNLYTLTPLDLGQAAKVIVSKESTIIMRNENTDEAVEKHLADLKSMESESMDATDKKFLNERIASISKGVGIIYVGGNSDIEQKEKYDRVDDAVRAVAAAVEDGILPGGGIALANCADEISHKYTDRTENFMAAVSILTNALIVPFTQIMLNAGEDPKAIGQTILDKHDLFFGYDAKNRVFGDLMKLGVVDPTKVTKSALINAVSVATTIVSTEAIVTNMRDESSK